MTTILIAALIGYMIETDYEPFNFKGLMELVREGEGDRDDEDSKRSALSRRFEELKNKNPESWACAQFENVNQSPIKT